MAKKAPHEAIMEMRGSLSSQAKQSELMPDDYGPDEMWDKSNPKSVYNMVTPKMRRLMDEIPEELWLFTPLELEKKYADITIIDRKLRQAFWVEYDLAHRQSREMRISGFIKGICARTLFGAHIVVKPHRFRYILEPPEDYKVVMQDLLQIGMDELREILKAPLVTRDIAGNEITDSKIAAVKLKAVEMLINRLQGMPLHRSMQITQNTNFNHNLPGQSNVPNFSEIKEVAELEKIVERLEGSASVLDMTSSGGTKDGMVEGLKDE